MRAGRARTSSTPPLPPPLSSTWTTPDGSAATPAFLREVQEEMIQWWAQHRRRDLPWRPHQEDFTKTRYDPYSVWVSEVMSQQTRMDTVIRYFPHWMEAFPTVEAVAAASEDDVRRVWSGLGFYRRAMLLRRGAQYILSEHRKGANGEGSPALMPRSCAALQKVPGIGPYTAAAIASVCYGEPVASVDGNVIRVLSRLRGEGGVDPKSPAAIRAANAWGQELMLGHAEGNGSVKQAFVCAYPGALNQGLMELGASVCRPTGPPLCHECPLRLHCTAYNLCQQGFISAIDGVIPMRGSKAKVREDLVACVVHEFHTGGGRRFVVVKRPASGLLGGMLEFPCLTLSSRPASAEAAADAGTAPAPSPLRKPRRPSSDGGESPPPEEKSAVQRLSLASRRATRGDRKADAPRPVELGAVRHVFSHINMTVHVYHVEWALPGATDPSKAEHDVCLALAAVLDAEDTTAVVGGDEGHAIEVDSSTSDDTEEAAGKGGRRATSSKGPGKGRREVASRKTSAAERISVMSASELEAAAPSRLCLKILHRVQQRSRGKEGLPRRGSVSPPSKAPRK